MIKWLGRLGYGAEGHRFESGLWSASDWKTPSASPALNKRKIRQGKDRYGFCLFICCA